MQIETPMKYHLAPGRTTIIQTNWWKIQMSGRVFISCVKFYFSLWCMYAYVQAYTHTNTHIPHPVSENVGEKEVYTYGGNANYHSY